MCQQRSPTGICPGALHLWTANHHLQKVCICWRPTKHACWWRLSGSWRGAEQGHDNTRWKPPDLEAKAQQHENGVGSLPSQQQVGPNVSWKSTATTKPCPSAPSPNTLELRLDRSLTYSWHLELSHLARSKYHFAILRQLAGSGSGAGATTLRTATLALVHSTAEYSTPVWCRSAHTCLIDLTINDTLRIVTGFLRPTPAGNLPILAGIQPAEFRRRGTTLSLGRRAMKPGHLLHSALTRPLGAPARASNRDTHLYPPHSTSSVFLTKTTYVQRSGPIINGTWSGRTTPQDYAL